jgi:hypothetical protein
MWGLAYPWWLSRRLCARIRTRREGCERCRAGKVGRSSSREGQHTSSGMLMLRLTLRQHGKLLTLVARIPAMAQFYTKHCVQVLKIPILCMRG